MYTRSYAEDAQSPFPDGYAGTMLEAQGDDAELAHDDGGDRAVGGAVGWLPGLGGALSGLFGKGAHRLEIGTEELLLIGVALFLLFSKSGDKECAVIFLLSLFMGK